MAAGLSLTAWDDLLVSARQAGLLGTVRARLEERDLLGRIPRPVRPHLDAAATAAAACQRMAAWEVYRIQCALAGSGIPFIVLKGAAYVVADLPVARGRLFSDIDVLVRKDGLADTE